MVRLLYDTSTSLVVVVLAGHGHGRARHDNDNDVICDLVCDACACDTCRYVLVIDLLPATVTTTIAGLRSAEMLIMLLWPLPLP